MEGYKRQITWCPNCDCYLVKSGKKCANCHKLYIKKKSEVKKRENKVKFIYCN